MRRVVGDMVDAICGRMKLRRCIGRVEVGMSKSRIMDELETDESEEKNGSYGLRLREDSLLIATLL